MRLVLLLLVTALLAWAVLQVVGEDGTEVPTDLGAPPGQVPAGDGTALPARTTATTGVLEVTVTSKSGHVPMGAEAGYRYGIEDRWRKVDERGRVLFTDAPLGKLRVIARAPGFEEGSQERFVNAGLRVSVIMVLDKEEDPAEDR